MPPSIRVRHSDLEWCDWFRNHPSTLPPPPPTPITPTDSPMNQRGGGQLVDDGYIAPDHLEDKVKKI